ncbi:MAG: hypothetical protein JXB88_25505 [Spirochaetales bacterium]|nr:hypothetical protein [Spirochaetales bacterium]
MAYFIPCSPAYQNAVKNPLSDRYWRVFIDVDDDDVLEDITSYLHNNKISGTGKRAGQNYEAVSNKYSVTLRNSNGVFREGDFALAKCAIEARAGSAGYIRLFTGYVTELGCSRTFKYRSSDVVTLEMLDTSHLIGMKKKTERATYINFKISDPTTPSTSIFHKLAYMLGLSDSGLELGNKINYTKPYISMDGNSTIWSELQALAQQYLGLLTFRYDGKLRFRSRHEDNWVEPPVEWTFDEDGSLGNAVHSISASSSKIMTNRCTCEFDEHEVLDQREIFRNVEGYNLVLGTINITVQPGEYWPGGTNAGDVAQLKYKDPATGVEFPIGINIQTPTIGIHGSGSDIECDGGLLTLDSFNGAAGTNPSKTKQNPDSSEMILYNNTEGIVTIKWMSLRGRPVRVKRKIKVEDKDASITNEWEYVDKTINSRYAVSPEQATITTQWWVNYGKVRRKVYNIETDWIPQIQEGAYVRLYLPSYSIDMICIVDAYTHPEPKGTMRSQRTRITLVEWMDFSPSSTPGFVSYNNQGNAQVEAFDTVTQDIENRPTYEEMQIGYTEGGGTTTPSIPAILICEAVATRAIILMCDRQLNLTNFDHFEWQVCADNGSGLPDGSWYALRFDGMDWKGSPDPAVTETEVEYVVHTGIPHTGTIEAPQGRKLHYRVRRVTKGAVASNWSASAHAITKTVSAGDIAAGSIYANNLVTGIINAMIARLNNYLEVGGEGWVGKTYGKTNGYQECGLSGKDKTLETGLNETVEYYFKIDIDGAGFVEHSIATGSDTTFTGLTGLLNAVMEGKATWEIVGGDLRCTSASRGTGSTIALAGGTSGTDLFTSLNGFTGFDTAVAGSDVAFAWGVTKARLYEDSIVIEFWNGSEWKTFLKIGGRYNNELFPYLQARGICAVDGEAELDTLDYGQTIPATGNPRLFRMDNSFADQNSSDPWDTKNNLAFTTADKKFGSYCCRGTADNDSVLIDNNGSFGGDWTSAFFFDFWFKLNTIPDNRRFFFSTGLMGDDEVVLHTSTQSIYSVSITSPTGYVDAVWLSENKIAVCFVNESGAIAVKIGTVGSDCDISYGPPQMVLGGGGGNIIRIGGLSSSKIVVSYSRYVGSEWLSYCKVGNVNGSVVSFGSEYTIQDEYSSGTAHITGLDETHFAVMYSREISDKCCRIGIVDGTDVAFGPHFQWSTTQDTRLGLCRITATRFLLSCRDFSTGYYTMRVADVTNNNEITYGTAQTASGTKTISSGKAVKLNSESFFVAYRDDTTGYLYGRHGYFSGSTPSFNTEVSLRGTEAVDNFDFDLCTNKTDSNGLHELIFTFTDTGSGNLISKYIKCTWTGVISQAYTESGAVNTDVSYGKILAVNPFLFFYYWEYQTSTSMDFKSRTAGRKDTSVCFMEAGKNRFNDTGEVLVLFFNCSGSTAMDSYHSVFKMNVNWNHYSINFDYSNLKLYLTINDEFLEINVSSLSLVPGTHRLWWQFFTDDRLDDLLGDRTHYTVEYSDSIIHYKKNLRWSILLDAEKDIVIVPGPGGTVYFPKPTSGKVYAVYQ